MTTTTTTFDTSKLSPRDRRSFENGMVLVSKKLAAAKLAEIRRKEAPQSFRIVPTSSKKFEASGSRFASCVSVSAARR
jgi:hypothetical protein